MGAGGHRYSTEIGSEKVTCMSDRKELDFVMWLGAGVFAGVFVLAMTAAVVIG